MDQKKTPGRDECPEKKNSNGKGNQESRRNPWKKTAGQNIKGKRSRQGEGIADRKKNGTPPRKRGGESEARRKK